MVFHHKIRSYASPHTQKKGGGYGEGTIMWDSACVYSAVAGGGRRGDRLWLRGGDDYAVKYRYSAFGKIKVTPIKKTRRPSWQRNASQLIFSVRSPETFEDSIILGKWTRGWLSSFTADHRRTALILMRSDFSKPGSFYHEEVESSLLRGLFIFNFEFANYQIPSKRWCAGKALSNRIAYF